MYVVCTVRVFQVNIKALCTTTWECFCYFVLIEIIFPNEKILLYYTISRFCGSFRSRIWLCFDFLVDAWHMKLLFI